MKRLKICFGHVFKLLQIPSEANWFHRFFGDSQRSLCGVDLSTKVVTNFDQSDARTSNTKQLLESRVRPICKSQITCKPPSSWTAYLAGTLFQQGAKDTPIASKITTTRAKALARVGCAARNAAHRTTGGLICYRIQKFCWLRSIRIAAFINRFRMAAEAKYLKRPGPSPREIWGTKFGGTVAPEFRATSASVVDTGSEQVPRWRRFSARRQSEGSINQNILHQQTSWSKGAKIVRTNTKLV